MIENQKKQKVKNYLLSNPKIGNAVIALWLDLFKIVPFGGIDFEFEEVAEGIEIPVLYILFPTSYSYPEIEKTMDSILSLPASKVLLEEGVGIEPRYPEKIIRKNKKTWRPTLNDIPDLEVDDDLPDFE